MSTQPAVTMQELELERAELLPSRETLSVSNYQPPPSNTFGLFNIALANGSLNNILSLGSGGVGL